MIPTLQPDHKTDARALFTDQFRGRKVLQGLIDSWCVAIQAVETMLWQVINARTIANAVGDQLDKNGALVGEARQGRNDANYKPAISLRIRVNRSNGEAEDVLQVLTLALGVSPFTYTEIYPAGFYVTAYNLAASTALALGTAIRKSRAAGTRGVFYLSTWVITNNLYSSSRSGGAGLAIKGFTSRYGGVATPGVFVSARET